MLRVPDVAPVDLTVLVPSLDFPAAAQYTA